MAEYERCIRNPKTNESYRAGAFDLYSSVYLPYADQFVTADERQHNALKEIVTVGNLQTDVLLYEDFRGRLTFSPVTVVQREMGID